MNYDDISAFSTGASLLVDLVQLLFYVGLYVFTSIALMAMFKKTHSSPWKAWVPVVREWELFSLAGLTPWWVVIIYAGYFLIVVGGIVLMVVAILGAEFTAENVSLEAAIGATVVGILLFMLVLFLWWVGVVIIMVRMANRINRGFGLSLWYSVLAVLVPPIWYAILAWGAPRWAGTPNMEITTKLSINGGTPVPIAVEQVVVGASDDREQLPQNTQLITINDPSNSVAPLHAQLNLHNGNWIVSDLESPAGTWYLNAEGTLTQVRAPIQNAYTLMVGNVRLDLVP